MTLLSPPAFLLAAAGAEHGGEENLAEVMIHHVANHDYPGMESWGFSKGVLMMLIAATVLVVIFGWTFRKSRLDGKAPKGMANALEFFVLFVRDGRLWVVSRPS